MRVPQCCGLAAAAAAYACTEQPVSGIWENGGIRAVIHGSISQPLGLLGREDPEVRCLTQW